MELGPGETEGDRAPPVEARLRRAIEECVGGKWRIRRRARRDAASGKFRARFDRLKWTRRTSVNRRLHGGWCSLLRTSLCGRIPCSTGKIQGNTSISDLIRGP